MIETCNNCAFANQAGECRRHAPLVTGGLHCDTFTAWPKIDLDIDWCGDFQALNSRTQPNVTSNRDK